MPTPYISAADLEVFMDNTDLNTPLVNLAVAAAMQSVRKYLDQEITFVSMDEVILDGTGTPYLRLPERPVLSVTEVQELDEDDPVDPADYFRRDSILILRDKFWTKGHGVFTVTYSHGWCVEDIEDADFSSDAGDISESCETVPADIILVTLSAARRAYDAGGKDAGSASANLTGENIGNYSYQTEGAADPEDIVTTASELIKAEKRVLNRYKIKKVVAG